MYRTQNCPYELTGDLLAKAKKMMNAFIRYTLLAALLISANAEAQEGSRLNIPLPRDATCLIKLGTGPEMRMPLEIVRVNSCADTHKATPVDLFAMDIKYPQMTLGAWSSAMNRIFAQVSGKDVLHVDEFPARIIYVFYPEQFKNPSLDDWSGPNPQVWQMKARRRLDSKMDNKDFEPIIYESKVKGLRNMIYAPRPSVPSSTPAGQYDQANAILIEPAGADYDLLMSCDATIECLAFVQLKVSRIQYRFLMPTEAVNHASELILAINRMIELWVLQGKTK